MIRLQDRLPDSVIVRGRKVKLDLDFRNVLRMMDILQDASLIPEARVYLACKCLVTRPRHTAELLTAVRTLLGMDTTRHEDTPRITDFDQDAPMIRTAFLQEYGIDLFTARLHWLQFIELLNELPDGSRYIDVLGIRARPIPAPTKYNQKEREWLMKAKAAHALHMSEQEQASYYENAVKSVFSGLLKIAEKGSDESNG